MLECVICNETLIHGDKLFACNHGCHEKCITLWYIDYTNNNCPKCDESKRKHTENLSKFHNRIKELESFGLEIKDKQEQKEALAKFTQEKMS
ncbi:MAG: hypothetical protein EBU66_13545 [Bacteroidetes bacterium]|nr:hypothetical protein [bacterium]NBP65670.1 hypothetical protein [Bacteroidota bacterium]